MEGTLNTYDKVNIKVGEYLGSTIRNWDVSKIEGNGPMRVEWYIEVDNGVELYALSTAYLNDSFDKDKLPYGLVITATGTEYVDENGGYLCGFDWFNYPRESVHIKEVYPELWNWLTTDSSYDLPIFTMAEMSLRMLALPPTWGCSKPGRSTSPTGNTGLTEPVPIAAEAGCGAVAD